MRSIHQVVHLPASPDAVYTAIMDSAAHSAFTGAPAEVDPRVGGTTSAFGGRVGGINLDLAPGERIVQAWRPGNFPPGVFTLATFALAAEEGGTRLTFTQEAVPEDAVDHLASGWQERYWAPLRAWLQAQA